MKSCLPWCIELDEDVLGVIVRRHTSRPIPEILISRLLFAGFVSQIPGIVASDDVEQSLVQPKCGIAERRKNGDRAVGQRLIGVEVDDEGGAGVCVQDIGDSERIELLYGICVHYVEYGSRG